MRPSLAAGMRGMCKVHGLGHAIALRLKSRFAVLIMSVVSLFAYLVTNDAEHKINRLAF